MVVLGGGGGGCGQWAYGVHGHTEMWPHGCMGIWAYRMLYIEDPNRSFYIGDLIENPYIADPIVGIWAHGHIGIWPCGNKGCFI